MAKELGIWNVEQDEHSLVAQMSWEQFLSWQAYYSLEPWGEKLHDAQMAQIVSVLAEVNRDKKQRPEPFGINDFTLIKDGVAQVAMSRRAKPLTDPKQWNMICGVLNTGRRVEPKPQQQTRRTRQQGPSRAPHGGSL